jgi:hypothetical protein
MRSLLSDWVLGMPDLSFYPESELRNLAFDHPVSFGREHRQEIAALVEIADLSLLPFEEAKEGIEAALLSDHPIKNYWGWIVCSSFGKQAEMFADLAGKQMKHQHLLVRTRAAEFLGITGLADPVPVITSALYETKDGIEAALILNTLVLLKDGPYAYAFDLEEDRLFGEVQKENLVQRRLEYILNKVSP